ncbi:hypothetical protein SeMB42_g04284 [Synchytrium endobioticum]|uniref:Uncharacterized protein n=1 Tax=Synchytrium endobioticum TaxID=286115 RepID=A0A507CZA9_9FUNG|nr:hypothetical protein SeMB42_g04284 [Synchytrium endobioticum]
MDLLCRLGRAGSQGPRAGQGGVPPVPQHGAAQGIHIRQGVAHGREAAGTPRRAGARAQDAGGRARDLSHALGRQPSELDDDEYLPQQQRKISASLSAARRRAFDLDGELYGRRRDRRRARLATRRLEAHG